jgi:ACS family sodium-dependent inorganic phosphate cotransporter-like MFS transporter 5
MFGHLAHIGSALALIAASYTGCDRVLTVFLLTIAVGFNGTIYAG